MSSYFSHRLTKEINLATSKSSPQLFAQQSSEGKREAKNFPQVLAVTILMQIEFSENFKKYKSLLKKLK